MKMQGLVLMVLLCAVAQGRVYTRCEWAQLLKDQKMDGFKGVSLADWVCLTQHESNYNTSAKNTNKNGSTDYGIFQINSKYWCDDGKPNATNACGIKCADLLDNNPLDDINCAKRIVQDPNGIAAWVAWKCRCKGKDLTKYSKGVDYGLEQ
ncbi:hypothetical protein WMY93_006253 [Mugilogobius chulae]|uniref:lysozyme n=1 Tax=Mugilogobius chulae TaxID=88201 RepID=A0AAW0PJ66_9GOBI